METSTRSYTAKALQTGLHEAICKVPRCKVREQGNNKRIVTPSRGQRHIVKEQRHWRCGNYIAVSESDQELDVGQRLTYCKAKIRWYEGVPPPGLGSGHDLQVFSVNTALKAV